MRNTFKLATILGIPIEINTSWFIILSLVVFTLGRGYFPNIAPGLPSFSYWLMGIAAAVLLFACLILHELSHSIVAKANNIPISKITLFVFGGVAHIEKEPSSPGIEFKMAAAGPIMSFFLSFAFWLVSILFSRVAPVLEIWAVLDYLSFFNLAVAIFNLVPGFPLDGGRIFRAVLWHFSKNLKIATQIASAFGKGFAMVLMAIGIIGLAAGNLVSGIWFIFLGFFLLEAAQMSLKQVMLKRALLGIKVRDIMTQNVISVPFMISIKTLMEDYFFRYRHNCFPVVKDDSAIGIVTFHDVKNIPKDLWDEETALKAMVPISKDFIITENEDIENALSKLAHNDIGRLLVIENDKLTGIISQRDIIKLFKFKEEAG